MGAKVRRGCDEADGQRSLEPSVDRRLTKEPDTKSEERRDWNEDDIRDDSIAAIGKGVEKFRSRRLAHHQPIDRDRRPPELRIPRTPQPIGQAQPIGRTRLIVVLHWLSFSLSHAKNLDRKYSMPWRSVKARDPANSASKSKEINDIFPPSRGSAKSDMDIRLTGIFRKRRQWNGLDGRFTRPLANMLFQLEQEALVLILVAAQLDPHNTRMASWLIGEGQQEIDMERRLLVVYWYSNLL
ncbi:hypothetical protein [Sphingobium nicotianae]|uniref:Uncharacterized protein n=1 Tax=Sphingobium nicotianae TaxID=2782607 RepID=A0A9X1DGD9_9SPHN|nr:hypothetical protein [Sphingobium nicotianae]MBT2189409.1 hypothetical protein [Sphingobium nicotianae]